MEITQEIMALKELMFIDFFIAAIYLGNSALFKGDGFLEFPSSTMRGPRLGYSFKTAKI